MRLRVFDLNTPWFWLTCFFKPQHYGKPYLELSLWKPHQWQKWWLNIWKWEEIPTETGAYAIAVKSEAEGEELTR